MNLVIRTLTLDGKPLPEPLSCVFTTSGGTIGRADDNTLALPDPQKHISRKQAEVSHGADGYRLRNIGAANPVLLNGHVLSQGEEGLLKEGDMLQIGGYGLRVETDPPEFPKTVIARRPAQVPSPSSLLLSAAIDEMAPQKSDASGGLTHNEPSSAETAMPTNPGQHSPESGQAFAPAQILKPDAPIPDPAFAPTQILKRANPKIPEAAPETPLPELSDPWPLLTPAFPLSHGSAPAPVATHKPSDHEAAKQQEDWWAAFCQGAGISPDAVELTPKTMEQIGRMLFLSIEGMLRLIEVRAQAKEEFRATLTVIQNRNNNPLKFAPDAKLALERILQPPAKGFMNGSAAIQDAMLDLLGHSVGTVAGMKKALVGVLRRFEPARLEPQLTSKSVLDTLLPMNRKARLWELYTEHFNSIRSEADADFQQLFGRAFIKAYEQQLDLMHASTPKS